MPILAIASSVDNSSAHRELQADQLAPERRVERAAGPAAALDALHPPGADGLLDRSAFFRAERPARLRVGRSPHAACTAERLRNPPGGGLRL
jgi:hypothetical protein